MNNNEKENLALVKREDFDIFKQFSNKKKVKISITHQLFTVSVLEYVCNFLNSKDQTNAQIKFKEICNKLVAFNVIGPHLISDQFRPIRFQYQKLLYAIFNQNASLFPEITQGLKKNQKFSKYFLCNQFFYFNLSKVASLFNKIKVLLLFLDIRFQTKRKILYFQGYFLYLI